MAHFHDQASRKNIKLKKGTFGEVMLKKMRAEENGQKNRDAFEYDVPDLRAWMAARSGGTEGFSRMEAIHVAAWFVAQRAGSSASSMRERAIVSLRWLKALGMTREGYADVRRWQFEYYMYDVADDNMKDKTRALFNRSPRDEALLKTYLYLVDMYSRERVVLLTEGTWRAQMHALRASLALEPYAATPPLLGVFRFCPGCRAWACVVEKNTSAPIVVSFAAVDCNFWFSGLRGTREQYDGRAAPAC